MRTTNDRSHRPRYQGKQKRLLARLYKANLLILDDWGLQRFSADGRCEVLVIVEQRHQRTIISSQLPTEHWHATLGEGSIADAILDRLFNYAYLELQGYSRRASNRSPPLAGLEDAS